MARRIPSSHSLHLSKNDLRVLRYLLTVAEEFRATIRAISTSTGMDYKTAWTAVRRLKELGLVGDMGVRVVRGVSYPAVGLTVDGIFIATLYTDADLDHIRYRVDDLPENTLDAYRESLPKQYKEFLARHEYFGGVKELVELFLDLVEIFGREPFKDPSLIRVKILGMTAIQLLPWLIINLSLITADEKFREKFMTTLKKNPKLLKIYSHMLQTVNNVS